jgi:hypothetical protein
LNISFDGQSGSCRVWGVAQIVRSGLFKQGFTHFIVDQSLLCHEAVVMSIRDHNNFCMGKPALELGDHIVEKRFYDITMKFFIGGLLLMCVIVCQFLLSLCVETEGRDGGFSFFRRIILAPWLFDGRV